MTQIIFIRSTSEASQGLKCQSYQFRQHCLLFPNDHRPPVLGPMNLRNPYYCGLILILVQVAVMCSHCSAFPLVILFYVKKVLFG